MCASPHINEEYQCSDEGSHHVYAVLVITSEWSLTHAVVDEKIVGKCAVVESRFASHGA